jgi:Protein of unknown function (DUF1631)
MMHPTDHRLNAALQAAMSRIRNTATAAAERAVDSLGIAAMSAAHTRQRDAYLSAQFELRRKLPEFNMRFGDVLIERVTKEVSPSPSGRSLASTDWHSLSLVEDDEVEELVSADRLGHAITEECEWELREVAAYMGSLLRTGRAEQERNPLRPEVIGKALYRAIECVSDQKETRKLLGRELGRSMAQSMRACYSEIVQELQMRGVQPVGLAVKTVEGPGNEMHRYNTGYDSGFHGSGFEGSGFHGSGHDAAEPSSRFTSTADRETLGLPTSGLGAGLSRPGAMHGGRGGGRGGPPGQTFGTIDPHMMELIRRLAFLGSHPVDFDPGPSTGGTASTRPSGRGVGSVFDLPGTGLAGPSLMAANLIRQHRDELAQASTGALDHMVIDVVGGLFDQILSDPKVPPQMARQIARLQLPVLRVALGDVTFFSSRRHPVRRFVNRIASLACAFEDFSEGPGLAFIVQVRDLVQQIVEGDFDQMDLYDSKLDELEQFIARLTAKDMQAHGSTATLLDDKDHELRLQQRYMLLLKASLGPLPMPDFMRDFLAQVWSQAVMRTVQRDGPNAQSTQRFRQAGRELVMSVQPKGSPTHRKAFLMKLPQLMKDMNEGLNLIGWPEAAKKEFFAKLLPAHAESLKGEPLSELSYNMLAKDVDAALAVAVPTADEVAAFRHEAIPELTDTVFDHRFSPEEAQQIGLVAESAVDWDGTVDIEIGGDTEPMELDINIDGLPPAESPEPTRGKSLMDHVQLGFAYQMHLNDAWQKVRLSYVSPGRAFFVFTRGKKHQETISMTSRMLARMCETGRLRAFENAYLIERATARARKQLAALTAGTTKH